MRTARAYKAMISYRQHVSEIIVLKGQRTVPTSIENTCRRNWGDVARRATETLSSSERPRIGTNTRRGTRTACSMNLPFSSIRPLNRGNSQSS